MKTTVINSRLRLSEYTEGIRFGTDALLLAAFVSGSARKRCVDLGTGSGVIPLLLLSAGKCGRACGIEIQEKYARAAADNARANGLDGVFDSICGDVRDIRSLCSAGSADYVTANPPYLRVDSGRINKSPEKSAAFHEQNGTIEDFARAAAYLLGTGGAFYAVYRPDRLVRLLASLSSVGLEPKHMRPVVPEADRPPSLILVKAVKGAAEGMVYGAPLVIYTDASHGTYSAEMRKIYDDFS